MFRRPVQTGRRAAMIRILQFDRSTRCSKGRALRPQRRNSLRPPAAADNDMPSAECHTAGTAASRASIAPAHKAA